MTVEPGILRYTLTKHFQDVEAIPKFWMVAINPVLERAVARATGKFRLPSEESSLDYLYRYFKELGLKPQDPRISEREFEPPKYRKGYRSIDWGKEFHNREHKPMQSNLWRQLRKAVFDRDGRACACCGITTGRMCIDHIKPKSKYPALALDINNMQVLCGPCNSRKHNRHSTDYRKHRKHGGPT